jgi:hypothetical protein
MSTRNRVVSAVAVLVIAGTLGGLWIAYRPQVTPLVGAPAKVRVPPLHAARATLVLRRAGSSTAQRATIACDGPTHRATGFWAGHANEACDALAATRPALLSGLGCRTTSIAHDRLHVVARFGARRADHTVQRPGCPDPKPWLAANALVLPVLPPDRELSPARTG